MYFITKKSHVEVWAQFDHTAQVYELYFDQEGRSFTGWLADSIKDAAQLAPRIIQEKLND